MIKAPPAATQEERAIVLPSLSPAGQVPLLAETALGGEAAWLTTALVTGGFDIAPDAWDFDRPVDEFRAPALLTAALGFLRRNELRIQAWDPIYGELECPVREYAFDIPEGMRAAVHDLIGHHVDSYGLAAAQLRAQIDSGIGVGKAMEYMATIKEMTAQLALAAVALDLPAALHQIGEAAPEALTQSPLTALLEGNQYRPHIMSAYGLAFAASRGACVDAIQTYLSGHEPPFSRRYTEEGDGQSDDLIAVGARGGTLGVPSVVERGLRYRIAHCDEQGLQVTAWFANRAMETGGAFLGRYVSAFERVGIFETTPQTSFETAMANGHAGVIRLLGELVDWSKLQDALSGVCPVNRLLLRYGGDEDGPSVRAAIALIDVAHRAGYLDVVMHRYSAKPPDKPVCAEPLSTIITRGHYDILQRWLEYGLDPNSPAAPGRPSCLEVAQGLDSRAAGMMRSFMARNSIAKTVEAVGPRPAALP